MMFLAYLIWNWHLQKGVSPRIEPVTSRIITLDHPLHAIPTDAAWPTFPYAPGICYVTFHQRDIALPFAIINISSESIQESVFLFSVAM